MVLLLQFLLSIGAATWFALTQVETWSVGAVFGVLGVFLLSMVLYVILLLIIYVPAIYIGEHTNVQNSFKHRFYNVLARYLFLDIFRVKMIVSGKENIPSGTKFVVYANHIEYTDPIYVRLLFRKHALAFVAKEPLFKTFLIKNLLNSIGCISIGKDADRSAMKSILESIKRVKDGQPFGIFPEGKRTYSNDLTEFKAGAFKLAQKANADIVPVCLYNMHGILRKGRIRTQKVYVHIFEAIPHEEFANLDTFVIADRVKSLISSKLEEFKERIPQD